MILATMIGYYVLAIGLLAVIGYVAAQQNARQFKAQADEMIAHLEQFRTPEQADEPTAVIVGSEFAHTTSGPALKVALGLPNSAHPDVTANYLDRLYGLLNKLNIQTVGTGITVAASRCESPIQHVDAA